MDYFKFAPIIKNVLKDYYLRVDDEAVEDILFEGNDMLLKLKDGKGIRVRVDKKVKQGIIEKRGG